MGFFDDMKNKLLGKKAGAQGMLTDDERELREYEEYYTPQGGIAEGTYSEFIVTEVLPSMNRGTMIVGTVTGGVFSVGDKVVITSGRGTETETEIVGIEQFMKVCNSVSEGANACLFLKDIDRKQVSRNDIIKKQ